MINILQIVDSLAIGGKEKMAVSITNSILEVKGFKSYICLTTKEGPLINDLSSSIEILALNKKGLFDIKAIAQLIKFIKLNKIDILHAHSSSFFIATICKLFTNTKLIWHDHNGKRSKMNFLPKKILQLFSYFFDFTIVVSNKLENWAKDNLLISNSKIEYLANFTTPNTTYKNIDLPGNKETRIVCVANLRDPKNHLLLLSAFNSIFNSCKDWHILLVGRDYNDNYSNNIKKFISENDIKDNVHILGIRTDISNILSNSTIGVLSSKSEGLPVSLLEYGMSKLPVVCTDVGYCKMVLKNGNVGLLSFDMTIKEYSKKLEKLISNKDIRNTLGNDFYSHVIKNYSKDAILNRLIKIYIKVLK